MFGAGYRQHLAEQRQGLFVVSVKDLSSKCASSWSRLTRSSKGQARKGRDEVSEKHFVEICGGECRNIRYE